MYPRVKVRELEEPTTQKDDISCTVKAVDSLSIERHSSRILVADHGSRGEHEFHPPHAKISKSRPKDPLMPSVVASKGKNNNRSNEVNKTNVPLARIAESKPKILSMPYIVASRSDRDLKVKNDNGSDEDNKTAIRASSVPPPRAALSSPDNDGIIGRIREKQTPVRRQTPKSGLITVKPSQLLGEKKTLAKTPTQLSTTEKAESCSSTRKVSNETGKSSTLKGNHSSELSTPRQRPAFKLQ